MGRTACIEPQCLYKGALYLYNAEYIRYNPQKLVATATRRYKIYTRIRFCDTSRGATTIFIVK